MEEQTHEPAGEIRWLPGRSEVAFGDYKTQDRTGARFCLDCADNHYDVTTTRKPCDYTAVPFATATESDAHAAGSVRRLQRDVACAQLTAAGS